MSATTALALLTAGNVLFWGVVGAGIWVVTHWVRVAGWLDQRGL